MSVDQEPPVALIALLAACGEVAPDVPFLAHGDDYPASRISRVSSTRPHCRGGPDETLRRTTWPDSARNRSTRSMRG